MLAACPALQRLFVHLSSVVKAAAATDEFLVRVSQTCKRLFFLRVHGRLAARAPDPLCGVGDRGLLAIRSLPLLTGIELLTSTSEPAVNRRLELTVVNERTPSGGSSFLDFVNALLAKLMTPGVATMLEDGLNVYLMLRVHSECRTLALPANQ